MSASSALAWSAYQLAVFRDIADGKGHTFVGAVAGSGKSTTIVAGLEYVPEPLKVLFCAFNKEASESLAHKLSNSPVKSRVECSTLHSYGLRQVTKVLGRPEINNDKTYMLIEELSKGVKIEKDIQTALVKTVSLAKATLAKTSEDIVSIVDEFQIDFTGEQSEGSNEDREVDREEALATFVRRVLRLLKRSAEVTEVIDFDDMIWLPVHLNLRVWQFDRVFGDEVQDWNACQVELMVRACKSNGRILAVGDERQAIYGFRGADENAVQNLIARLNAKTLLLSVSYRCPKAVIREAQQYVPAIEHSPTAIEGSVTNFTYDAMKEAVKPGDFILSRTNAPLISICLGLLAEGRKAFVAGRDLGKNLSSLIKKSKAQDVRAFLIYLDSWSTREISHLANRLPPKEDQIRLIQDKADCLKTLCEGAQSLNEVEARITALFSDKPKNAKDFDASRIVLSTTHRAKGLERKNVFLLRDTYLRPRMGGKDTSVEESNLYYVAVTRSQENLYLVRENAS